MTTATLSFLKLQKNFQSRIGSFELPKINWKFLCFSCFFVAVLLLVFYVWQVNILIKGSYLIDNYKYEFKKLSDINKNLQISFAENSFLGQALVKIQSLDFQKTNSVKYIQMIEGPTQISQAR